MARLFSEKPKSPDEADRFQRYFKMHGRYTVGVKTRYAPSEIAMDDSRRRLATGLIVGMRLHSAPVIRAADARRVELGHCLEADGRWRLIAFAPPGDRGIREVGQRCAFLQSGLDSPHRYATQCADYDSLIGIREVFQISHRELLLATMPTLLIPRKVRYGLIDYEKIFCADPRRGPDKFDLRGIDRERGALVVVRPDQFVADVLPIQETDRLSGFFDGMFVKCRYTNKFFRIIPDLSGGLACGRGRNTGFRNRSGSLSRHASRILSSSLIRLLAVEILAETHIDGLSRRTKTAGKRNCSNGARI